MSRREFRGRFLSSLVVGGGRTRGGWIESNVEQLTDVLTERRVGRAAVQYCKGGVHSPGRVFSWRTELLEHRDTRLILALLERTVDKGSLSGGQFPKRWRRRGKR